MALPNFAQISCNANIQVSLTNDGTARIYPDFILEGNQTGSFEVSLDNITFSPFVDIDCTHLGSNTIYVTNPTNGNTCWGEMIVEDKLKPTPYAIALSTALLNDQSCSIELWAIDFLDLSFDNCGIVAYAFGSNGYFPSSTLINDTLIDLSVDHYFNDQGIIVDDSTPSESTLADYAAGNLNKWNASVQSGSKFFFEGDAGNLNVSVTDGSGNSDFAIVLINFSSCNSGIPSCIDTSEFSIGPWGPTTFAAHNFLKNVSNYDSVQVSFDDITYVDGFTMNCDDLGDHSIFVKYTYLGLEETCTVNFSLVDNAPPVVVVKQSISKTLNDVNDVIVITTADIDNGSYDICTSITLNLSKTTFDVNDLGSNTVYLTAEDENGNWNSTSATVLITLDGNCPIVESDIVWPDDKLTFNDVNADPTALSPENLVAVYGFANYQVEPNINVTCAATIQAYSDIVIDVNIGGVDYFKILRTWTVLDWMSGVVFEKDHIISNVQSSDIFICDFLPRIAPLGDCASGHTDTDDVEWPNDIALDDHRISPSELVSISNVDPLDAEPSFYNEPSQYSAVYEDVLIALSATEIELGRRWTVTRLDNGFTYNYTQLVSIDISSFGSLVTVSDPIGRAVSGVEINGNIMTDDRGRALVTDEVNSIDYELDRLEGITIRDLVFMQRHILGIDKRYPFSEISGDINVSESLTGADAVELRKILLGVSTPELPLLILDRTDSLDTSFKTKGNYTLLKTGDIDGSAFNGEYIINDGMEINIEDQILNAGELYTIPVKLNKSFSLTALDLTLKYEMSKIEIVDVIGETVNSAFSPSSFNIQDNQIRIAWHNPNFAPQQIEDDILLHIQIRAKENTLVSLAFNTSQNENLLLDQNFDFHSSNISVLNKISTPTFEVEGELSTLTIYPNPAQDLVNFRIAEGLNMDKIVLFDLLGSVVLVSKDVNQINVQDLENGVYIYQAQFQNQVVSGKIEVVK